MFNVNDIAKRGAVPNEALLGGTTMRFKLRLEFEFSGSGQQPVVGIGDVEGPRIRRTMSSTPGHN